MGKRIKVVALSTFIILGGVSGFFVFKAAFPQPTLLTEIPEEVLIRQPEIDHAYNKYVAKGNKYIWGKNDCSIFVMDYLEACKRVVPFRPTTLELMSPDFMEKVDFRITSKIKTGDILVFRYQNANSEWRGHTGIVVWHQDRHWVVHNTESYNGVVMEALPQFMNKALSLTKNDPTLFKSYQRNDYETWFPKFSQRRSKT